MFFSLFWYCSWSHSFERRWGSMNNLTFHISAQLGLTEKRWLATGVTGWLNGKHALKIRDGKLFLWRTTAWLLWSHSFTHTLRVEKLGALLSSIQRVIVYMPQKTCLSFHTHRHAHMCTCIHTRLKQIIYLLKCMQSSVCAFFLVQKEKDPTVFIRFSNGWVIKTNK